MQEDRIPLTQVPRGGFARVACTRSLGAEDSSMLEALGLAEDCCLRVCGSRGACILELGGPCQQRSRIAVARGLADKILVSAIDERESVV